MHVLKKGLFGPALFGAGLLLLPLFTAPAQPLVPLDAGTTVNGYQDDFDGTALKPGWAVLGANAYSVANGMLHVSTPAGDPNHLLYQVAGYDNSVQEVLARIRVTNFGTGDGPRGGIATVVDPNASPAGGIDLHFRDENLGRHIEFLDDLRSWGTEYYPSPAWQNNVWYWLRMRHEPNAASQGGANDVFGKIWLADGSQAEPAAWQNLYDYIPTRSARTGYAGIVAGSSGGTSEFDVDYILIKAAGLPSIVVAPAAFPLVQTPAAITNQPADVTVTELASAGFLVGVSGNPPPTLQWYTNGAAVSGQTNLTFTIASTRLSDNGALISLVASNLASNVVTVVTSRVATLTVNADVTPPVLLGAQTLGLSQVQVFFSERISPSTAANPANYVLTSTNDTPPPVAAATLDGTQSGVVLTLTNVLIESVFYTLTVNSLSDQSAAANPIATNSQAGFLAISYAPLDIGSPTPAGGEVAVAGGYNVTGGGSDIGGTNDHFQFSYQQRSGDFDVKVRLDSLGFSDAWAEAGLIARESLAPDSRSAGTLATPSISGAFFQSRSATNGATTRNGSFPVNYPNTWLRLQRVGNQFTGYAGADGQSWWPLGTVSLSMQANVYFGFAASSHNINQTTTAAFRALSDVVNPTTNSIPAGFEPLGQSSRKTSLVISEIMYHPGNTRGTINTNSAGFVTNSLEFIELFNALGTPEDISGYRLSGDIDYTFPPGTVMPGGSFLVVARSPLDLQSVSGLSGVLGPFTNNLPNGGGTIRLRNPADAIFLEVNYDNKPPWPVAADGAGHSLVLARPSLGEDNPAAWAASDVVGGSPGRLEPLPLEPLRAVVINEFLAHTDAPDLDFIELYNHSNQPLDVSGCFLSDDPDTNKFVIPPSTILPPLGFLAYDQNQLGFSLSAEGETIYFRNAANTRVLDCIRYEGQATGVSFGRSPDGSPVLRALATKTPGTNNSAFLSRDIVINEIMFSPISLNDDDQYVELYNKGNSPVNVGLWSFTSGINFTFPSNTIINPDSYLVVARNAARLKTNYNNLSPGNLIGDFTGTLSHGGERLALAMPVQVVKANNHGGFTTNTTDVVVNEVTYNKGGRWGQWSGGGGSSLELTDPRSDNTLAANWADSDETAKAPWTFFTVTGNLDNSDPSTPADELQVLQLGAGECLIDDVQVLNSSAVNQVANSSFETDATGWTAEGTEEKSGLETSGGYNSAKSYHIRAVARGDNQPNRVRTVLTSALVTNTTATIRAQVRWLKGNHECLFRLRGKWLDLFCQMTLPANLGTPGARNSRAVTNAPPAIHEVAHSPVLPAGSQPVVVTARVHDPDGLAAVVLKYRLDPSLSYSSVTMLDNGTSGDAVAGDGLYSATIPGQASGTMVAFYVQATDAFVPPATSNFPNDAPTRECLVRFGEVQPAGNFPAYRIWMTQATLTTWNGRNHLNNSPNDVTFVLGNQRAVYNTLALYAGSPYIAPGYSGATSGRCGYTVTFPDDDLFLGSTDLVLDWPGGHGGETSAMQEQMGYYIINKMNLPYCHRYTIRLHVNGVTDDQRSAVFEAVNQPSGEFTKAWMPNNSSGDFYKIDRGFEFNDAGSMISASDVQPRLDNWTSGGVKKTSKYRWNWYKRANDSFLDYTNVYNLVDAVHATYPEPYTTQVAALADIEEWMGVFAADHIIVNFDCWGHEIGKNMYGFKPDGGKWQFYLFDLDWLMLAAPLHNGTYAASSAPLFNSEDPNVGMLYTNTPFRRAYFRAVQDAVNGPLVASNCNPVMDAKYNSLINNGIRFCDGNALTDPTVVKTWFSDRRAYLVGQLNTVAAGFTVATNSITSSSNLITLNGTAPVTVKDITVNGIFWPVTWNTITSWTLRLPVSDATNQLAVLGLDKRGNVVAGASNQVTVVYTGAVPPAQGAVVFNEIMYTPALAGAEYVELFNTSSNFAFDLSSWQVKGLGYTFPQASFITPRSFLVLAKSRAAALAAYGTNVLVFDQFTGALQPDGETLTLIRPGASPAQDLVISKVRYEARAPWPAGATNAGVSLQLIDASQDPARVSNWSDGNGWRFASLTGNFANGTNVDVFMQAAGEVYIDDVTLVPGAGPYAGINVVTNGGFEAPLSVGPWLIPASMSNSARTNSISHSGSYSLHVVATNGGNVTLGTIIKTPVPPVGSNVCTLSFWYHTINSTNFFVRSFPGSGLNNSTGFNPRPAPSTPGASNGVAASVAPYPLLWINEVQPDNLHGITDGGGQYEPWLELYNAGTNPIALDGYSLANNYTNLAQWAFPPGTVITNGEFKVIFADGETNETTPAELHANFRLSSGSGSLALSRSNGGSPEIVDYVNYQRDGTAVTPDRSYGSFPDGQPFDRQEFYYVTPGGTNNGASAPLVVFINEWMASNTRTLADLSGPTPKYDDWFELYNPGTNTVSLAGYYLTDALTNKFQYLIPAGYTIAPGGFLLVWADGEPNQNTNASPDLHVNFQLSKTGEQIGLFAADGTQIDAVTFGAQTNDVSEGRCPDGGAIRTLPSATPRATNTCPPNNTPPVLMPIGNKAIHKGQTLTFTASATDSDLPAQMLTFSLDGGAPAGAGIDASSGLFTWANVSVAAPSTYNITVRVTDNGTPTLDAAETITISVLLPLKVGTVNRTGNQLILGWETAPGQTYRVVYKNDLSDLTWTPLGNDLQATGSSLSVTNNLNDPLVPKRFYAVQIAP